MMEFALNLVSDLGFDTVIVILLSVNEGDIGFRKRLGF